MRGSRNPEPFFYDKDQAILKYGCNDNLFSVSSLNEYCRPVDSRGFAIKFVTEGNERYTINRQSYNIGGGSYLLLNGSMEAKVEIESKQNVKGICINIATGLVADAVASIVRSDTPFSDPELASFFYTDSFLENQYTSAHTLLGNKLQKIGKDVQKNVFSTDHIHTELFLELAGALISDQASVFKQLQAIPTVKPATRRDLCRRLIRGREFIDSAFASPLTIEQVARESAMSEYHFFRLFKKVFGVSPHQYILGKRLSAAQELLKKNYSVSDVALECGFADIYAFSKAFKNRFGITPSSLGCRK